MLLQLKATSEIIDKELRLMARDIDKLPADEQEEIRKAVAQLGYTVEQLATVVSGARTWYPAAK